MSVDIYDLAKHGMSGKEDTPKKEIQHIRIRKSRNGGHVIEHHHTRPEHHPMEEHVTQGDEAMLDHMKDNMGGGPPSPDAGATSGVPEPQAAPMAEAGV